MIARKLDREMLAALTRLGFEINDGGHSAYAECSVLIGDDMDFRIKWSRTMVGGSASVASHASRSCHSQRQSIPKTTRSWA